MTIDVPPALSRTRELASAYAQAWNDHDVDALLSMQTAGMAFHLHLDGSEPVTGTEQLRELFGFFFDVMPDYHGTIKRELIAEDFFVWEYTISATLAKPFPIGRRTGQPPGRTIQFDAVDIITCVEGKVVTKDIYLDGFAMHHGMNFS